MHTLELIDIETHIILTKKNKQNYGFINRNGAQLMIVFIGLLYSYEAYGLIASYYLSILHQNNFKFSSTLTKYFKKVSPMIIS